MRTILDEATDPWGIKVNRVEVKNIMPPQDIRDAMEKQMRAERERRESILRAEGEKRSEILRAEGAKEAAILRAEADKESQVRRAEGEAEAIIKVQEANAQGIRLIKEAGADKAYLTLQSFETMKVIADGQATKIIIPSELQGIAGLMASAVELLERAPSGTKVVKSLE
jgi:regulator of protease activity HflC (stomatin/prohibitin superfamily)